MQGIYLGLGTNLGEREKNLADCLTLISTSDEVKIVAASSIYETEPNGFIDQPKFLNMVIEIQTWWKPTLLLAFLQNIELQMGRKKTFHWGPRIIDIDILSYHNVVLQLDNLTIPHEQMPLRKFVLIPLAEIAQNYVHPESKKSLKEMLTECPDILKVTRINKNGFF